VQAQLVQSEKLASLGQLVGGAAHELNNPLTAMMGYSELLTATPLNGEQRSLAQKIEHQIRRTRTLVSSLLSFAKQVPAEKTSLNINAMVQTAVKLYPPQLRTASVQVYTDLAHYKQRSSCYGGDRRIPYREHAIQQRHRGDRVCRQRTGAAGAGPRV
jgi:two-component system NtrC family sensor kinase